MNLSATTPKLINIKPGKDGMTKNKTSLSDGLVKTFDWYFNNANYFKSFKKKDILTRLGNIND